MTARHHHVIRAEDLFAGAPASQPPMNPETNALGRIRESGLVGMGGAGFPTYRKLAFAKGAKVVIANGAECEPLLEHNVARMETDAPRILAGLTIAMGIVGAHRGIIAVKPKNADAVRAIRRTLDASGPGSQHPGIDPDIEIALLKDGYPAGDERAIIRDVLGQLLPVDALPIQAGAVVVNVESLMRMHDAVVDERRVTTKDITVAGDIEGSEIDDGTSIVVYDVPIGLKIREILGALGIHPADDAQILLGGPYMGSPASLDDTITATTGGIMIGEPEIRDPGPLGIIVCACGASEERLRSIAAAKGATVADTVMCRNAVRLPNGKLKCRNPGICPGQAQAVLALRKAGAKGVLISHCTDCTNTVMQIAPRLGMRVHHATDAFMRAGDEHLIRAFRRTTPAGATDPTITTTR